MSSPRSENLRIDNAFNRATRRLQAKLRGSVVGPSHPDYDLARQVYNAMIDRRPRLIVKCRGVADIVTSLKFARRHELALAIRSSGHSAAGHAVCDDGMVLDLTEMKTVRVDPKAKLAWSDPGATWADFDAETQAFGLATPGGTVSTTSVSGLTLGGGIGWLLPSFGLTCDNLVAADVVTADAHLLHATADANSDLFWALRGGGGNFGVISSFAFRLHDVSSVIAGSLVIPLDGARDALLLFGDLSPSLPDEVNISPTLFRREDGTPFLSIDMCYRGRLRAGLAYAQTLAKQLKATVSTVRVQPYIRWQRYLDPLFAVRMRGYWKSLFVEQYNASFVDTIVDYYCRAPSRHSSVILESFHGAVKRVPPHASAYSNRHKSHSLLIATRWHDPADDAANVGWTAAFGAAVTHFSDGSGYLNYMSDVDQSLVTRSYDTTTHERLVAIKRQYDPTNTFRFNHNIRPGTTPLTYSSARPQDAPDA